MARVNSVDYICPHLLTSPANFVMLRWAVSTSMFIEIKYWEPSPLAIPTISTSGEDPNINLGQIPYSP
jgi:hypothetical protein